MIALVYVAFYLAGYSSFPSEVLNDTEYCAWRVRQAFCTPNYIVDTRSEVEWKHSNTDKIHTRCEVDRNCCRAYFLKLLN